MAGHFSPAVMAELTSLGEAPLSCRVSVVSLEFNRLTISSAPVLIPGTPVSVRQDDGLWLGEVVESTSAGVAVIQVVHSLSHLGELSRLADRFLGRLPQDRAALASPKLS